MNFYSVIEIETTFLPNEHEYKHFKIVDKFKKQQIIECYMMRNNLYQSNVTVQTMMTNLESLFKVQFQFCFVDVTHHFFQIHFLNAV